MNQQNNATYYFLQKALEFLLEREAISQDEFERASRHNAESLHPGREYISQFSERGVPAHRQGNTSES